MPNHSSTEATPDNGANAPDRQANGASPALSSAANPPGVSGGKARTTARKSDLTKQP